MIDTLMLIVQAAAADELKRARDDHGYAYASPHEAYGVLSEEVYEAEAEMQTVTAFTRDLVWYIHSNDRDRLIDALGEIEESARRGACELIQVAAVCRKALAGLGGDHG